MHKLAVLRSVPMITELMHRLEEASIKAVAATERNVLELHAGGALSTGIYVEDRGDLEAAAAILRDVRAQHTAPRCPTCDYDLRGHTGRATCPECGRRLTARTDDVQCPKCGESVPPAFEICWSCGTDLGGETPG